MNITPETIKQFAPGAIPDYIEVLTSGALMAEEVAKTPLRWCHFLAQIAHETAGLTVIRESMAYTPAQICKLWPNRFKTQADPRLLLCFRDRESAPVNIANLLYSSRKDLGNEGGDDGWVYRGGGMLQLTGRANYRAAGLALGLDLEGDPNLIEEPAVALSTALWVWGQHPNNTFADRNYGRAISNAINRGNPYSGQAPNGAPEREQLFRRAWAVFGGGQSLPKDEILWLGAYSSKVQRIQGQLKQLGYQVGAEDGAFGPTMARAVAGFKLEQKRLFGVELEPEEGIGELTEAALDAAPMAHISVDRMNATVSDLMAAGSTEMASGHNMQNVGRALTTAGLFGAAHQSGVLDQASSLLSSVHALQVTAVPVLQSAGWVMQNAWWLGLVVGGVYCWRSGFAVKLARLAAHRLGFNLAR